MPAQELPRNDDGTLQTYARPGGYAIYYLDSDNNVLCPDCARKSDGDPDELPRFRPVTAGLVDEINDEAGTYCDQCSKRIQ